MRKRKKKIHTRDAFSTNSREGPRECTSDRCRDTVDLYYKALGRSRVTFRSDLSRAHSSHELYFLAAYFFFISSLRLWCFIYVYVYIHGCRLFFFLFIASFILPKIIAVMNIVRFFFFFTFAQSCLCPPISVYSYTCYTHTLSFDVHAVIE